METFAFISSVGLVACQDDVVADEPFCPEADRYVDVHFPYHTGSQLESDSCELEAFGLHGDSTVLWVIACGWWLEVTGASLPAMDLEVGDTIEIATNVDEVQGCAENGWLTIADAQGRMQFAALAVTLHAAPLELADLGMLELTDTSIEGCRSALRLRALGDEATVASGTSTEVELGGVRLLVQLGLFGDVQGSCGSELYGVVLFRVAD